MFLDHITVAVPDLADPLARLDAAGIHTAYGGVHSNGITHMALASFLDGAYLEVVAPVKSDGRVSLWSDFQLPHHGGSAWTVGVDDVAAALAYGADRGVRSHGPITIQRTKPNGTIGSWDLAYFGDCQPGGVLPFLIHDATPREVRVPRDAGTNSFTGWNALILAVWDHHAAAEQFARLYGWSGMQTHDGFSRFPGTPIYLHTPLQHLRTFGECPWAAILTPSDEAIAQRLKYAGASGIFEQSVHWLDLGWNQFKIGVETS